MAFDRLMFADKLKRYREQFEVSFSDLSNVTGISIEKLKTYELGELIDKFCPFKISL
jgi:predicted transcriptional regulator